MSINLDPNQQTNRWILAQKFAKEGLAHYFLTSLFDFYLTQIPEEKKDIPTAIIVVKAQFLLKI